MIFDGKQKEAKQLANESVITKKSHGQLFQPVGSLHLAFGGHENFTNYHRELDIERAVAKTSYAVGGVTYTREVLASFPNQVVAVHLTASTPNSLSFTASFATPHPNAARNTTPAGELVLAGTTADHEGVKGRVKFRGIARIKTEGGSLSAGDTTLAGAWGGK